MCVLVSASGPSAVSKVLGMLRLLSLSTHWRHFVIMWLTESSVPQVLHLGYSFFSMRYPCGRRV